jgi:serine/threonine-protein kinase
VSNGRFELVKRIYLAALERDLDRREAYVQEACGGDGTLRAEVDSLLSYRPQAVDLFGSDAGRTPVESVNGEVDLSGRTIQHYAIEEKIGEGGMGVVYRAEDLRLGRRVALKFLSVARALNPEALDRFRWEARVTSALNHPNICTVHDISECDGRAFLVLEHLSGETLASRLKRGPLPIPEVLEIGAQIADALGAAHRQGVVHRDLKPGNVMLTQTGAKLLDFGIAKLKDFTSGTADPTPAPPVTQAGEILGTVPYMAPEQLEGGSVDARTDVWALGLILYEMCSGKRVFEETTRASLIAAIMDRDPVPLSVVEPSIPLLLEYLVERCLSKSPAGRWESAVDVATQLRWMRSGRDVRPNSTQPSRGFRLWQWGLVAMLSVGLTMVALLLARFQRPGIEAHAPQRLNLVLPGEAPLAPLGFMPQSNDRTALSLSPDGSRLAYVAAVNKATTIYIRHMEDGKTSALAGTEGGFGPFFSPDGQSLGFFAAGRLKKISFADATGTDLADAPNPFGAVWAPNGVIYFNRNEGEGISQVADGGGSVSNVGPRQHFMPELVPRMPMLLATDSRRGTEIIDLGPGAEQSPRVVVHGYGTRYSATGHLVFASDMDGKLTAIGFDPEHRAVFGKAVTFYDDLRTAPYGVAQFALGGDGTLIYAPGRSQMLASFVWVSRTGKRRSLGLPENTYGIFDLSRDGTRLAYNLGGDIWIRDLERGTDRRFTSRSPRGETLLSVYPHWTPDGRHIVYMQRQASGGRLVCAPLDGRSPPAALWTSRESGPEWLYPMSFSPDGTVMSAIGPATDRSFDIYLLRSADFCRSDQNIEPELFLGEPFNEGFGQISPDGRWMLYASDHTGRYDIYVTPYPKRGPVYQVTRRGGREPRWNPAGHEILYLDGSSMYSVEVLRGEEFRTGEAKLLFEGPFPDALGLGFDITRDGQWFLMLENAATFQPTTILTVVTGFSDELRRRIPRGSGAKGAIPAK